MEGATLQEQVDIRYGHSETHVLVVLSRPIDNLRLTPEQARAMIAALTEALAHFEQYHAEQAQLETRPS